MPLLIAIALLVVVTLYISLGREDFKSIVKSIAYIVLCAFVLFLLIRFGNQLLALIAGVFMTIVPFFKHMKKAKSTLEALKTPKSDPMTLEEAREILEVSENATKEKIKEQYIKIIEKNHPDKGGSKYLAVKINQARDLLLKNLKKK